MNEWNQFKVGQPAIGNGFNPSCCPFDTIYHTSHVEQALGIIQSGGLRPSLVFDESRLNDKRILVAWLSPNHWTTGYRYGNIRFQFPFSALIENKRFYWVEAISYKIDAPRILITEYDRSSEFPLYDPIEKNGPWWYDTNSGQHYFNNKYCLEFMFESVILLDTLKQIKFVDHHKDWCSVKRNDPISCPDMRVKSDLGGAWFIARAIACGIDLSKHEIGETYILKKESFNHSLSTSFKRFFQVITNGCEFGGKIKATDPEGEAIMKAVMSAFAFHQSKDAKILAKFFFHEDDFTEVAAKMFANAVGWENWRGLLD